MRKIPELIFLALVILTGKLYLDKTKFSNYNYLNVFMRATTIRFEINTKLNFNLNKYLIKFFQLNSPEIICYQLKIWNI